MKITICGGIVNLTKFKRECIDFEYNGFQKWMIFGINEGIYSEYRYTKGWQFKKIKYKEYPLRLPSRFTEIEYKPKNTIAPYWIRFRTKKKYGGIWIPMFTKQEIPEKAKLLDSFLQLNHKGDYEVRLNFEIREVKPIKSSNILAVDIGDKRLATICDSLGNKRFLGTELRGIRMHFLALRRKLGNKKLFNKIKVIADKEKRVVDQLLHRISKEIVDMAFRNKCSIVLGNLSGIRKKLFRKVNRINFKIPFYKLSTYITYKATAKGIRVFKIGESYTSKTCHKCGSLNTQRPTQSLFKCSDCHLEYNADLNGAINLLNRFKSYMDSNRAQAYAQNFLA